MAVRWKIHKFGGTSVLNAERYRNVAKIISTFVSEPGKAVVVSAMKGVTDDLFRVVDLAKSNKETYKTVLQQIHERHRREITDLLPEAAREKLLATLNQDFKELDEIMRGVWLVKNADEGIYALISGMGEVWSAQILNAFFQSQGLKTDWLDARKILVVENSGPRVTVNWQRSKENLKEWLNKNTFDLVTITGFVAGTETGAATTLGRNGSDYSASIFGQLLGADEIFIWTDVDGVFSADPRLVPEAVILSEMSYSEVAELAYFGATVVHPATMAPAIESGCVIWIKNSLNPESPGTKIHKNAKSDRAVKGFSTINKITLLNIEGSGMVGVPGVAERLFGSLRTAGVNVVLISQGSSEQSICLAVTEAQSAAACAAVERAFANEIRQGLIQKIQVTKDVSILAAVGDNMVRSPGIAGKVFTALGQSGVNVRAIAQGSSERNISVVIDSSDAMKALRTVHSSFILPHQRISVGLIGVGLIGGMFLNQLHGKLSELKTRYEVDVQVRAIANSKKMLLSATEIPLEQWQDLFAKQAIPLDIKKFTEHLNPPHIPHAVIIEATASSALAPYYKDWLNAGLHIVSQNKKANTGTMKEYAEIRAAAKASGRHFLYSTNVGAGLPILQTLRDLCATGDEIFAIEGILSGTLSFIFNQFDGTRPFSEIVLAAKEQGYTEPDPREDLDGQDVMRKLVILAREAGVAIETQDVEVTSLVPESMRSLSIDEFMQRLPELDAVMSKKIASAKAEGKILRFVGILTKDGRARVGLEALPTNHAFSRVSGTDNIVQFKTKRYFNQPLVIQGPGAGPDVTAAGVFADLLRLSRYLGAKI